MRLPSYIVLASVLCLAAATGCSHPAFNGTLNEVNPGGPQPGPGDPVVNSMSPASVVAGGVGFPLTIMGQHFAPGDSVIWAGPENCTLMPTSLSSTQVQVQIPASCYAKPGGVVVNVEPANPSPLQFGDLFTITVPPLIGNPSFHVSSVAVQANDMVWDPTSQQLYLSVVAANTTNGNTITALDPTSARLGISSPAGGGAHQLAVASDGSYLYATIDNAGSVQRYTLPTLATDINIPLGSYPIFGGSEPFYAIDLQVDPVKPHTIAVVRGGASTQGDVALYDDAVQRTSIVPSFTIGSLTWNPGGTQIYGNGGGSIVSLSVDPGGVHGGPIYPNPSYGVLHYAASTGYLYADSGQVIDPSTGNLVGTFPLSTLQGGLMYPSMTIDDTLHIAYFIGQTEQDTVIQQYAIEAFDLTHFTLMGATNISDVVGTPVKLLRWGPDGLAFLTSLALGRPVAGDGVYLVQGGFVTSPANRISPIASDTGALPAGSEH